MRRSLLLLCLALNVVGCTKTIQMTPLSYDDLGPAAKCEWRDHQPFNCVADPARMTLTFEYFSEVLADWQKCQEDAFDRRKL